MMRIDATGKKIKKNIFITDDVGLGKTIEVGIIIKEKLEREYDNSAKILIIVPKFCVSSGRNNYKIISYFS